MATENYFGTCSMCCALNDVLPRPEHGSGRTWEHLNHSLKIPTWTLRAHLISTNVKGTAKTMKWTGRSSVPLPSFITCLSFFILFHCFAGEAMRYKWCAQNSHSISQAGAHPSAKPGRCHGCFGRQVADHCCEEHMTIVALVYSFTMLICPLYRSYLCL